VFQAIFAVFGARKIDGAQQIRPLAKNTAHNPRLVPITDERRFCLDGAAASRGTFAREPTDACDTVKLPLRFSESCS
jgi:hypothetical protein